MILFTSESTRRKELLEQIGFHVVLASEREIREDDDIIQKVAPVYFNYHAHEDTLTLDEVKHWTVEVARLKVRRAVNDLFLKTLNLQPENIVVVGADTIVYFDGRVLDRPLLVDPPLASSAQIREARNTAKQMLSELRGQNFCVLTGLVVAQADNLDNERYCCVVTEARMKNFSDNDIECYIRTGEPLDKAGGFGIQEMGVILFERIRGSYSNVVGLPLVEFVELLRDPLFEGRVRLRLGEQDLLESTPVAEGAPRLSVVSVGDINYDLAFNKFPAGFFADLHPPGEHVEGELYRATGGTAAIFAVRARSAGFRQCSVLGVIGGDALGQSIAAELFEHGIETLLPADRGRLTSIALILRDKAEKDTLITLTDARQSLSLDDVRRARHRIEEADVLFVSGYCLTDPRRQRAALQAMEWAKKAGRLVVLDVTVGMDKVLDFATFADMSKNVTDILVAEIATILAWLQVKEHEQDEWPFITGQIVPNLRKYFSTLFLRTSTYSHEIIVSPAGITGPFELDYSRRASGERLGYADEQTSRHLYHFMSPRLLLASASPRRLKLLKQIVAENKVEVLVSNHKEMHRIGESPVNRVKRLALEKARQVLARRDEFSSSIELIIGADTEIVIDGEVVGHPSNDMEARQILRKLSGKTHQAITGLALIDTNSGKEGIYHVTTRVGFKRLSEGEIEEYIRSGEPIGKAGAYGIQGKGALFIEEIDGSYSNVVGLPLERLSEILDNDFRLPIWDIDRVSHWSFPHERGG